MVQEREGNQEGSEGMEIDCGRGRDEVNIVEKRRKGGKKTRGAR